MKKNHLPTGFSGFSWALAMFCVPVLLWPLALTISPNLLKNPHLSSAEASFMSIFLWIYPFCLALITRLLYKLHQKRAVFARQLLILSAVIFYGLLFYVGTGFA